MALKATHSLVPPKHTSPAPSSPLSCRLVHPIIHSHICLDVWYWLRFMSANCVCGNVVSIQNSLYSYLIFIATSYAVESSLLYATMIALASLHYSAFKYILNLVFSPSATTTVLISQTWWATLISQMVALLLLFAPVTHSPRCHRVIFLKIKLDQIHFLLIILQGLWITLKTNCRLLSMAFEAPHDLLHSNPRDFLFLDMPRTSTTQDSSLSILSALTWLSHWFLLFTQVPAQTSPPQSCPPWLPSLAFTPSLSTLDPALIFVSQRSLIPMMIYFFVCSVSGPQTVSSVKAGTWLVFPRPST